VFSRNTKTPGRHSCQTWFKVLLIKKDLSISSQQMTQLKSAFKEQLITN